ncbi:hypothetical protein [Microvirga sp. TS319]|uniref:hypothetical protein n=1 Tax=Microvirga sp. TS319 TaxID=3241165 RepID=UPI00351A9583
MKRQLLSVFTASTLVPYLAATLYAGFSSLTAQIIWPFPDVIRGPVPAISIA